MPTDTESLPDEFRTPVAIADDLLEPVVAAYTAVDPSEQTTECDSVSEINEDVTRLVGLNLFTFQGKLIVI